MFPLISKPTAGCVYKIKDKNLISAVLKYKKNILTSRSPTWVYFYTI